jgi:mRNA-degrading endonuclease toxin of MazEF toxin-antitoxin module
MFSQYNTRMAELLADPPEGGLTEHSVLLTEQIHPCDQNLLSRRMGRVTDATIRVVEDRVRIVLGLDNPLS